MHCNGPAGRNGPCDSNAAWRLRGRTHAFLDEVGEAGLDRPTKSQPPGFMGLETVGKAILIIAVHATGHLGGLNVVRAAAGKQRLFVPSEELRTF
jgi:hypothetical protein